MPHALRRLIVKILIFLEPCNPVSLLDKYYTHLSKDDVKKIGHDPQKRCSLLGQQLKAF